MNINKYVCVGCDIETIPTQDVEIINKIKTKTGSTLPSVDMTASQLKEALKDTNYPLSSLKLSELKELYLQEFGGDILLNKFEKEHRKTSFDAMGGGEVISVSGYAFGFGTPPVNKFRWLEPGTEETGMMPVLAGPTEFELIDSYFRWLDKVNDYAKSIKKELLIVGANVKGFDFKFLARRALHLGVELPNFSLCDSDYSVNRYFDVISIFGFFDRQDKNSLDSICKFLNIETSKGDESGDINGSMVYDIWKNDGKAGAERIAKYNIRDCLVLEPIFNKLHKLVK